MAKEAADAVRDERPFAGVHILATALLCAGGSSNDELELARRILERDPKRDAPRETESVAGAFNRHMDAAIDSVNDSVGESTRAGRRARLAHDLDKAGLVLVDRAQVAELIAVVHELRGRVAELEPLEGQDLGAELADDEEPCSNPHCDEVEVCIVCQKGMARDYAPKFVVSAEADDELNDLLPPPGTYGRVSGYAPSGVDFELQGERRFALEFMPDGDRGSLDTNVND